MFFALALLLGGCGDNPSSDSPSSAAPSKVGAFQLSAEQQASFARTCGICHGVVGTGAPAPHDRVAWEARNAQGMEVLLDHTLNGFGGMPPMGMCMDCTQDDFVAFIQYMSGLECEP